MNEQRGAKELDRYLFPLDAWAMAFGCMVGWGAFVMPGTTFLPLAGPAGTIISMAIGLAVMLVIAYSVSYLMTRSPRTGGVYSYTKEAFGRDHAFLCSWFLCLSYLTIVFLNGTALFLVIRTMLGDTAQEGYHYTVAGNAVYFREVALSVFALAAVGLLFIVAKPILQRLHTVLSAILLAGTAVTAAFCLPRALSADLLSAFGFRGIDRGFSVFSLVILAPWAFVGFEVISMDTAHFRFPVRKNKGVIFAALLLAALVYTAMTLVSVSAVPDGYDSWAAYVADLENLNGVISVPTFYAASRAMGPAGLAVMGVTALAAILTGIIGAYRATMRVLSTMAEDKILSDKFSKTTYSILFIMVLSILISLLGRNTLNWFVDLTSFGAIVAYGYTSAAAWKIARTENNRRIMITSLIGAAIAIVFGVVQLVPRLAALDAMGSEAFLLLSLWCLLGFVFYWRTVKRSTLTEYSGMSKEFVEKMFNAFERERTSTDSGVEGTGLGLAITKSIVDLMGGTIEVLTSPGSGTEMIIRVKFRLASEQDLQKEAAAKGPSTEEPVDFSGRRLLLVEDNAVNLEIAKMILEQLGFLIETAENGQIAVDKVSLSPPGHYDAVLMDIQMPVMDGYTAARKIRALDDPSRAGVPILAMTANAFQEDVQSALNAGMQAHIAKPIDIGVLTSELQAVLKKQSAARQ